MDARYAAAYPDLYRNHWWWRVRERILLATIQRLVRSRHARILDVGCGAGLFFDSLEQFGDICGIRSDPTSVAQDSRWAHRIFCGELDESSLPSSPFDLILMLDVLEHVPRPHELLRHAARILGPEGRILVTVPAFQWLWTAHDDMNHHARRYTLRELCSTIQESGLVVLESRYL